MLTKITIVIASIALVTGCSDPEDRVIPAGQPALEPIETPKISIGTSLLDQKDESTDYRDKYTNAPPKDPQWIEFDSFRSPRPATWFWVAPKSSFVICNYVVPGVDGSELATFAITQFDEGEGGDLSLNVKRWKSKFNTFHGAPVKPSIKTTLIIGKESTVVELRGEYMGAGAAWHRPDQTLLVVIFEDGSSTFYFKLLGPTKTVEAHRESLFAFLSSIEFVTP
jgi:hypothetical protein